MHFLIQPATVRDLSSLHKLEHACFPQDAWPLLDLLAVLTFSGVIRLKAVINNHMVGFIAGDPRPSQHLAWIATLAVLPDFRNQGIGTSLLNSCLSSLNYDRVRLCVRPENLPAIKLYRSADFQIIDRWNKYYNDHGDALVMEKWDSNKGSSTFPSEI